MAEVITKAFTHGGRFHADDVFSAALLRYLYPSIQIERGYQVPEDFDGIVFDIGLGEYDHHQNDRRERENGVAYAAFGLLWERFGASILGEEEAKRFDEKFIQPLDINDNTGEHHELAAVIGSFNPAWDSTEDANEAFLKAVDLAQTILELKFKKVFSVERAKTIVEDAIRKQQEGIMVMEIGAPWKQFIANTGIEFVVSPSQRGGYNAQAVEIEENEERKLICPFPESWRGKTSEQLQEISGIESLHFVHNSGFLAATKTLDDAILACKLAKKLQNENYS